MPFTLRNDEYFFNCMSNLKFNVTSKSKIAFSKMHGLGNDFVLIDLTQQSLTLTTEQVRYLCNRHFGIGCDQLLLLQPALTKDSDFAYEIYNADGTSAGQCGNGARCLGQYIFTRGLSTKSALRLAAPYGVIELYRAANGMITVNMGVPNFAPAAIPFIADQPADFYTLKVGNKSIQIGAVGLGNPHAVLLVPELTDALVNELGPLLENHPSFPQRTNVGFMQIMDKQHIRLRVYERGVGETLACGSGACAAMVIGRVWGKLAEEVAVDLSGGRLTIRWSSKHSPIEMTGPAEFVFEGFIVLPDKL